MRSDPSRPERVSDTPIKYLFRLAASVVGLIERAAVNVFVAVMLSLVFILIGQPGVDWLLVSPVFATISEVGVIVPVRAFLRSKTQ